jgi:hypothetical protein
MRSVIVILLCLFSFNAFAHEACPQTFRKSEEISSSSA